MRLAALILLMPLAIIIIGLLLFASVWADFQEDRGPEPEEARAQ